MQIINEKDNNLHKAIKDGDSKQIKQLLKDGANPNATNRLGHTALKLAITSLVDVSKNTNVLFNAAGEPSHLKLRSYEASANNVKILLSAGADPNINGGSGATLLILATRQNPKITELLLQNKALPNIAALDGSTALMLAMHFDNDEAVQSLVNYKANLNQQDNCKKTALIWGARSRNVKCLQVLINAGADVNIQEQSGRTSLIWAVQEKSHAHIEALLKAGAKVNIADKAGNTALDIAYSINEPEIIEMLKVQIIKENKIDIEEKKHIQETARFKHRQANMNRQKKFREFMNR